MLSRAVGVVGQALGGLAEGTIGALSMVAGTALDALSDVVSTVASTDGPPEAESDADPDGGPPVEPGANKLSRVHVAVRGVHRTEHASAVSRVERRLAELPGVTRAEVNAVHGRAMVEFDPSTLSGGRVTALVRAAVEDCGLAGEAHAPLHTHDPSRLGPLLRHVSVFGAHAAGFGIATARRLLAVPPIRPPAPFPVRLAASLVPPLPELAGVGGHLVALVDVTPRLRSTVEQLIGEPATDTLLNLTSAGSNLAADRSLGLLVDGAHWLWRTRETRARRQAWSKWESALARQPGAHRAVAHPTPPRPAGLPPGPVERLTERSSAVAVCAAAAAMAAGATPLVNAALAAGAARAAKLGREGFATQLDRDLSGSACLVQDPRVLRLLDRVDTVIVDGDVLSARRDVVDEVLVIPGDGRRGDHELTRSQLVERAHDLINPWRPANRHGDDGWRAEPVEDVRGQLPAGAHELAGQLAARGATVMALLYEDRPVAVVGIGEKLDPFARALIAAARCADRVVIAGSGRRVQRLRGLLESDDICPGGGALVDSVRELQRDGHVVALVDASHGAALAAADLGIGLVTPGRRPPWGAQVLVTGTSGACQVLDAITPARRASRRGVQLALVGSGLAALLAVLGPGFGAARRAHFGVHTTALVAFGAGVWEASELTRLPGAVAVDDTPWHAMSARAVLEAVGSSRAGISEQEARRRDTRTARRELDEPNLVRASLAELATPLTPALGIGAGLAAATGSVLDSALILTVLGLNALIGGVQRVGAQRSLRALRHTSDSRVRVRRPHAGAVVRPNQLVVGDVVALQAGQAVPADCRLLEAQGLEVDESSLTGESLPVAKSARACAALSVSDRFSMLYEGTTIAAGRAEAVVTAIEDSTEAGRALRLRESAPPTGVELRLRKLTTRVLPFSAAAGLILIAVDLLRVRPLATSLSRAVGLAVAAVPEGLPFVATVAELAAARRLSGRGALVRNPSTIEALGRVTTLCFDKTGTLTEGCIALRTVGDGVDVAPVSDTLPPPLQDVLAVALRASPFHLDPRHVTHQTDRAVLAGAADLGLPAAYGHERLEHIAELAFESSRGYHATLWRGATALHLSVKGAPEVVLPLCARWSRAAHAVPLDDQAKAQIGDQVHRLAQQGQRVLAVAEARLPATAQIPHPDGPAKLTEADLVDLDFVGLVGLFDPIRPTAARSVATLRAAGVDVIMITGDHPSTARTIAAELDAVNGRHVLTGAGLDELDDEKLAATLPDIAVFARVTPAQKARIVRALQQIGAVVAVTGDGTNDAPAIRLADVGIALGSRATPAAREAADLVVTDDRIETITDAIVEGRALWSSVRDALSILLGGNLGEIAYTLGTGLLDGGESLNARQLLLINLLTDVLPAMAVAVRPPPDLAPDQLLAEGPEDSLGASLNRDIALRAATTSVAASAAWFLARPLSTPGQASTTGLVALVAAQLGQTIAVRGRTPLVIAAALGSLGLLALAVQTPGVSHIVGSRPLLPHQWGLALTAASAATAAQLLGQRLTDLS